TIVLVSFIMVPVVMWSPLLLPDVFGSKIRHLPVLHRHISIYHHVFSYFDYSSPAYPHVVDRSAQRPIIWGAVQAGQSSKKHILTGVYPFITLLGDRKSTRLNSSHGSISYA